MNQPIHEGTYRVSELCEELKLFVGEAFPRVWVQGEAQRINRSRAGHVYFELVENGEGDNVTAKLDAVIWASDMRLIGVQLRRAGAVLEDGVELRLLAALDFYPPQGRLQLRVRRVDPEFLLGRIERQRREALRHLAHRGLVDRNRELELAEVPLCLALVTSVGSAAYHDFLTTLRESGWGFQISAFDTVVQGAAAPESVAAALAAAGKSEVDAVVLVRGGGARSDLHAFDTLPLASAIATCPKPVIVGLGHQIDVSVSDRVAHTSAKTPTEAASFLVQRVDGAAARLAELTRRLATAASGRVERQARVLARHGLRITRSLERVSASNRRLQNLETKLHLAAEQRLKLGRYRLSRTAQAIPGTCRRRIAAGDEHLRRVTKSVAAGAAGRIRVVQRQLDGHARLISELAPERLLARGFSVTRKADGSLLRSLGQVTVDERLVTRLRDGRVHSRVEEKHEQ